MKLAIFGSTGGTGRHLVKQALEQGHSVTAFARNAEKIGEEHEKLQTAQGDVMDFSRVEGVVNGHDAVMCALGLPAMTNAILIPRLLMNGKGCSTSTASGVKICCTESRK